MKNHCIDGYGGTPEEKYWDAAEARWHRERRAAGIPPVRRMRLYWRDSVFADAIDELHQLGRKWRERANREPLAMGLQVLAGLAPTQRTDVELVAACAGLRRTEAVKLVLQSRPAMSLDEATQWVDGVVAK